MLNLYSKTPLRQGALFLLFFLTAKILIPLPLNHILFFLSTKLYILTKFEKIERDGDQVKLYFYAEAGLSYTLEGTDSFPPTGWQTLTNISAAPITTLVEIIDEVNSPQRFYRLNLATPAELPLSSLSQPMPGRILLHFDAKPGQSYTVEYCDSLTSSSWQVLTTISPVSETSTITVCDPDPSQETRFYRVRSP